jgi:copper(I)-binding protein
MLFLATSMLLSSITAVGTINPIIRAGPAGEDVAAYLVIRNSAGTENRLVEVRCDCAERVEIHNVVGSGGERRMAVEPGLALPPGRLTEIAPGGARHLMLIDLRARLVPGQRVSMTFRFANREETREVPVVADTAAAWSTALAEPRPPRLQALAFLAGSCWRGTFPDGRQTDTHCFSPIYGGNYLQDRHVVEGAAAPYSGDTLYSYDVMGRSIRFEYRASDGSHSVGRAVPTANGLSFPEEVHRSPEGREMTIRSSWTRDGADAYVALSEAREGSGWRELWRMRMVRIGPTPPR